MNAVGQFEIPSPFPFVFVVVKIDIDSTVEKPFGNIGVCNATQVDLFPVDIGIGGILVLEFVDTFIQDTDLLVQTFYGLLQFLN